MAQEQHRVLIGLEFQPGRAIEGAIAAEEKIRGVFRRLNNETVRMGGLDAQSAQQFGAELQRSIQNAMRVDLRNSPVFQSLRQVTQDLVRQTTETPASRYTSARFGLTQAELARAAYERRAAVPLGGVDPDTGVKGYRDKQERYAAEIRTAKAVEDANIRLANARKAHATQIANELSADRRAQRDEESARARSILAIERRTAADVAAGRRQEVALARSITAINKRADAERAAAERVERAAQADREAAGFRPSYVTPDVTTPVGKAQAGVNRAEAALEVATRSLATLRTTEGRSAATLIASEQRVAAANQALIAAHHRLAQAEATNAQSMSSQSFRQQFMTGFHGRGDRGYAEQIGQAFKFSLFYGTAYKLLFALTQTFQQTLQEGIEFQQAVSELKLATGQASDSANELAASLGQQATAAGFAPSQGVLIGARSVGLYGATGAPEVDQARIAEISARVVSRLAFASGMQPADLQTNIAAVGQAFGQGYQAQFRIADLDAYMGKEFGVAPGQTIQAVAEAGNVAAAAGYSMEEVSAIAALLQGRTGQTPAAVAGYMAQIFSRGGEGTLTGITQRYGIDPTLELSEQIRQLAQIYKAAPGDEQSAIASAFGRGKVQNAVVTLLTGLADVDKTATEARTEAGGALDRAVDEKFSNVGGQIQLTLAAMQDFANQLGQAGVLSVIGAGVALLRELTEAGTNLLRLWNQLDGPMKAAIAGLIAFAVAAQRGAFAAGAAGLGSAAGLTRVSTFAGGYGAMNRQGVPQPLTQASGIRAAGRNLLTASPIPAMALAIGGLYAVGELSGSSRRLRDAQESAADVLASSDLIPGVATADAYRTRAAALGDAALAARDSAEGWAAEFINRGADKDRALSTAKQLEAEAARHEELANRIEAAASVSPERALVSGFDPESLASSMDAITASGGTARERLDALTSTLFGTADAAGRAQAAFDPTTFAGEHAENVFGAISEQQGARILQSRPGKANILKNLLTYSGTGDVIEDREYEDITGDLLGQALSQGDVQARLQEQLSQFASLGEIDKETAQQVAQEVVGNAADVLGEEAGQGGTLTEAEVAVARDAMVDNVRRYLLQQTRGVRQTLAQNHRLTQVELGAVVAQAVADAQNLIDALPETDLGGRVSEARSLVQIIRQSIRQTPDGATPEVLAQLGAAERALAQAQFNRFEQLRKAAQQNARSRAEVARIGRSFLRREIRAAIAGGNQDVLAEIIGQAGAGAIRIARQIIQEAINAARAANRVRLQMFALQRAAQADLEGFVRGGQSKGLKSATSPEQQSMLDMLDTALTSGGGQDNVYLSGSDVPGYEAPDTGAEKEKKDRETALERAAAAAAARAARSESAIGAARAEMMSARAAMAEAKKGTVEYYNALASYYSARNQLTDAILDYRNNRYLLGIDTTDPLAQAQAQLRAARAKLRSDRGKGADVQAADRVAVQEAEANREATAFQQRLDAVQTAEQLGRISHAKYLDYLDKERRRLDRIKDRTFQQQQQLDQIDTLLKEAASAMDAQWNFGDINLPTPYQVRRYIEETSPDRGSKIGDKSPLTHPQTTIYIDGADTGAVKRIIEQHVGKYGRVLTTSHRHR